MPPILDEMQDILDEYFYSDPETAADVLRDLLELAAARLEEAHPNATIMIDTLNRASGYMDRELFAEVDE